MNILFSYDKKFVELIESLPMELREVDGIGSQLDLNQMSSAFFNSQTTTADISIDDNSNVAGKDVITYNYEIGKPLMRLNSYYNLWKTLNKLYGIHTANEAIKAQVVGDIYINDSWDIGRPYCFNFSTLEIALEGLRMSKRLKVAPAKGLSSFLRQVEQFVVYAANSTLGATGLADLLLTVSVYYQHIKDTGYDHRLDLGEEAVMDPDRTKTYLKEQLTSLIYTLNWEFRGHQSPFTNVSVYDDHFLQELLPWYRLPGKAAPTINTVREVQHIFLECMNEAIKRTQATFPIVTACFSMEDNEIKDKVFLRRILNANSGYGFINFYHGKTSTLSSCCRLRSDRESLGYTNSFGAGGTKIGSLGVVTLNLPRILLETPGMKFTSLVKFIGLASQINHAKRVFINDRIEKYKALPLYSLGHMSLEQQYSTIGFLGLWEATYNTDQAQEVLRFMDAIVQQISKEMHIPHNIEQVPGESAAIKLVKKDLIHGLDVGVPFYSNQFVPLHYDINPLKRIEIQGRLDPYCSGGSILHLNMTEPLTNLDAAVDFVEHVAAQGVVYWAMNHVLHVCSCGYVEVGKNKESVCPKCFDDMDMMTRVVGFLTKKDNWNETRRDKDFNQRSFK